MNTTRTSFCWVLLISLSLVGNLGCPMSISVPESDAVLDNLDELPDADGDGFADLESPEGTDDDGTIAVEIVNEITRDDAEEIAKQFGGADLPPGVIDLVTVTLDFSVERNYATGETLMDTGTRSLEPFEILVEASCPETIVSTVDVTAIAPIIGSFEVMPTQTFTFTRGDSGGFGFECGTVISIVAGVNGNGQPDIDVVIEDQ